MDKVPDIKGLLLLGENSIPKVNIPTQNAFRKIVNKVPNDDFVWVMSGNLRVLTKGKYKVCTKSDDGSKLYVNGNMVVNNDGLHGPEQRCGDVDLGEGRHLVTAVGFQRGGGAYMDITYS
jgi:hypothetical protein